MRPVHYTPLATRASFALHRAPSLYRPFRRSHHQGLVRVAGVWLVRVAGAWLVRVVQHLQ